MITLLEKIQNVKRIFDWKIFLPDIFSVQTFFARFFSAQIFLAGNFWD